MVGHGAQEDVDGATAHQLPGPTSMVTLRAEPHHRPKANRAHEVDTAEIQHQGVIDMHEADQVIADWLSVTEVDVAADLDHCRGRIRAASCAHTVAKDHALSRGRDGVVPGIRQRTSLNNEPMVMGFGSTRG